MATRRIRSVAFAETSFMSPGSPEALLAAMTKIPRILPELRSALGPSPALVSEAVLVAVGLLRIRDRRTHVAVVRPAVLVAVDFLGEAACLAAGQVIRVEVTRPVRRLRADGGPVHEDRGADHDLLAAG